MRDRTHEKGFTLIEVLIGLVILAVGLAGMVPVVVGSFRGNRFGDDTTQSATYSQDTMEQLRRMDFGACTNNIIPPDTLLDLCGTAQTDNPIPGLTRRWTVAEAGGSACDCNVQIVVIEVCTAKDADFNDRCVATPNQGAGPSHNFLAVRSNL